MKKKDIQNRLKSESDVFVPDIIDKIKIAAKEENLLQPVIEKENIAVKQKAPQTKQKQKQWVIGLVTSLTAVATCCALVLTLVFGGIFNNPSNPITLSTNDIYAIGGVSTIKLLGSNMSTTAIRTFSGLSTVVQDGTNGALSEEEKKKVEKFNKYFSALDSFLGEDIVSTTVEKNTDSNYPYETKMTIIGKDINGTSVTYTMYYTEALVKEESKEDEEDKEDEQESEYQLEGVMVFDGVEYYLEGERSEESEKDEREDELKIRAYADLNDKSTYIQMEQEISVEAGEKETEYVYSIYQDGILIEQTAVEFDVEQKNKKTETQYELEFRNGSEKEIYTVDKVEKDKKITIKVKYDIDGKKGEFHIREIVDKNGDKIYEYSFSNGDKLEFYK